MAKHSFSSSSSAPNNFVNQISSWLGKIKSIHDSNTSCIFCSDYPVHNNYCDACQDAMPITLRACRSCALPLEYSLNGSHKNTIKTTTNYSEVEDGYLCQNCHSRPPAVDCMWAPYAYYPPLSKSLHLMKFSRLIYHGFVLGNLWKQIYLQPQGDNRPAGITPDLILPTPLHVRRQSSRGFNQAEELITPLADMLDIPVSKGKDALCIRSKATEPQINLNPEERSKNLRNAFSINKQSPHYKNLQDKTILVVDDVVTTGATINELAKCLKKAGAAKVVAWSLLRA